MDVRNASLSDGSISLRPWTDADVPSLTAALQEPEIPLWIPIIPSPYSEDDARGFIERVTAPEEVPGSTSWAIEDAQERALLGQVGFPQLSLDHKTAEVGYWVVKDHRGQGVCTRALKLLSDWAFNELGLERLELRTLDGNIASEKVAIKCGFTKEGVLRSLYEIRGERRGMTVWSLLKQEWDPEPS